MERWVELIIDLCPVRKYFEKNKEIIFKSINSNRDKDKLLSAKTRFYSCLINFGYSEEYLYKQVKEFFQYGNNEYERITIKSANVIRDFVNQFDFKEKDYEFVLLIDNKTLDYFKGLNLTEFSTDIEYFDEGKIAILTRYKYGKDLVDKYHEKCKTNENIKIVRYKSRGIDYLSVINRFEYYMDFVRSFESYFKHFTYYVNVYFSILKITKSNNQEDYISIADRDALQKDLIFHKIKLMKELKQY
jgi:hypothetical protein